MHHCPTVTVYSYINGSSVKSHAHIIMQSLGILYPYYMKVMQFLYVTSPCACPYLKGIYQACRRASINAK